MDDRRPALDPDFVDSAVASLIGRGVGGVARQIALAPSLSLMSTGEAASAPVSSLTSAQLRHLSQNLASRALTVRTDRAIPAHAALGASRDVVSIPPGASVAPLAHELGHASSAGLRRASAIASQPFFRAAPLVGALAALHSRAPGEVMSTSPGIPELAVVAMSAPHLAEEAAASLRGYGALRAANVPTKGVAKAMLGAFGSYLARPVGALAGIAALRRVLARTQERAGAEEDLQRQHAAALR